jgi:ribosomal protein L11 methyltransferase
MSWQRVAVSIGGEHAQALADALEAEGAISVEIADDEAGTAREEAIFGEPGAEPALWSQCRVSALFVADADASRAVERAIEASGATALAGASLDRVEDEDWVAQTQRQFTPLRVGTRLWIVPTWHEAPEPGAVNLVLDPGAAFGTGSHPTTRLCLEWLERRVTSNDTVLDYGCGSGILGIAALKLGARAATAVDIDPLALETASYNAHRNGVPLKVLSAASDLDGAMDLTVANILANPLRMLAPLIAARTHPGGSIALSGVLDAQAAEVIAAYDPWAALRVERRDGDWVLLTGMRKVQAC